MLHRNIKLEVQVKEILKSMMTSATALTRDGRLLDATRAIQQALRAYAPAMPSAPQAREPSTPQPRSRYAPRPGVRTGFRSAEPAAAASWTAPAADPLTVVEPVPTPSTGSFLDGIHAHGGITLHYKLYVPATVKPSPALILMLHGCTQDADDFARGTQMNARAEADGFLVLYPTQSRAANAAVCWNWFRPEDHHRGAGEADFLVHLTNQVVEQYGVDPARVYAAGLSAGAAMAATLGSEYPDVFAAVAVHAGLPQGAARNIPDALTAMRSGTLRPSAVAKPRNSDVPATVAPTIIFHGDQDRTVHPSNADHVVDAVLARTEAAMAPAIDFEGNADGRPFKKTVHRTRDGQIVAEKWLLTGVGHAWSGGDPRGTHTAPGGVDASGETLRFFAEHPRAVPAAA